MLSTFGNTVRVRAGDDLASLGAAGERGRDCGYKLPKRTDLPPPGNDLIRRELLLGAAEHRTFTHPTVAPKRRVHIRAGDVTMRDDRWVE